MSRPHGSFMRAISSWKTRLPRCVTRDRKSTRLNSSHGYISYAVFCLKKKKKLPSYCDALFLSTLTDYVVNPIANFAVNFLECISRVAVYVRPCSLILAPQSTATHETL